MSAKDYFDMLHHVPQRADESRFARDYREQHPEQPQRWPMIVDSIITAINVAGMMALAWLVWVAFAVLTP